MYFKEELNTITNQWGAFHLWYSLFCIPVIWGLAVGIKAVSEKIYKVIELIKIRTEDVEICRNAKNREEDH